MHHKDDVNDPRGWGNSGSTPFDEFVDIATHRQDRDRPSGDINIVDLIPELIAWATDHRVPQSRKGSAILGYP
jgi:hypothetical protein